MSLSMRLGRVRNETERHVRRFLNVPKLSKPEGLTPVEEALWATVHRSAKKVGVGVENLALHRDLCHQVVTELGNTPEAVDALRFLYESDGLPGLADRKAYVVFEFTSLQTKLVRRHVNGFLQSGEKFDATGVRRIVRELTGGFQHAPSGELMRDLERLHFFTGGATDEASAYLAAFTKGSTVPASTLPKAYYRHLRQILTGLEDRRSVGLPTPPDPKVAKPTRPMAREHATAAGFSFPMP